MIKTKKLLFVLLALLFVFSQAAAILAFADASDDPSRIVLDDTSDSSHWATHAKGVLPYGAEEGAQSIYSKGNHNLQVESTFDPVDISMAMDGEDTVFGFWVYIVNEKFFTDADGQIELTSSGACDVEELAWTFGAKVLSDAGFVSGKWNRVELSFAQASRGGGDFRPENVSFFRLYQISGPYDDGASYIEMTISTLYVASRDSAQDKPVQVVETKDADPVPSEADLIVPPLTNGVGIDDEPTGEDVELPSGGKTIVLDDCDTADKCTNITYPDTRNFIEGSASLFHSGTTITYNSVFPQFAASEMPAFDEAYLELYIYVENLDLMTADGQIELNSSGVNDMEEIYFVFSKDKIRLQNGWNFISLKLSDFIPTDGKFVYSELIGMRIYAVGSETNALRVDNITITDTPTIDYIRANGFTAQTKTPYKIGTVQNENTDLYSVLENFPQ